MTVRQLLIKRLGALAVIREYLERLQLKDGEDALAPVREAAHLTNGEVVEALVANRLTAPRPLYDTVAWAEGWAVKETFGIRPEDLNDDRLGRCLDDLAAIHDALRGEVTVQAMTAFGLETKALRWDLTSVLVTGADLEEEQVAHYTQVRYSYSSGEQQIRYLHVTTDDGAVPIGDEPYDGNTPDVATVIATMRALRAHARGQDFVLLGDRKLLSTPNRRALLRAGVGYLVPLARTSELDAAFLAIPPAELLPLAYVSERERGKPPDQRTSYLGAERSIEVTVPDEHGGGQTYRLRPLFVVSSEERATCQRHRARQRERAEALDGDYVLETTRTPAEADATALLAEWKGQWQLEQRHRDAKGPLRIRPLFVTSNRRIVGLATILGLALLVFSLIERAARRALAPGAKVPNLLAGHVAARPTGDNLFKALRGITPATHAAAPAERPRDGLCPLQLLSRSIRPCAKYETRLLPLYNRLDHETVEVRACLD